MREAAFHWIAQWISQYGYAGIFSLLVFGIVGLPVPDEWLLTFSGYLVFKRTLVFAPTFVAAFAGSSCGITFSYLLGRLFDTYVLLKYGRFIHLTPERLARVHTWFERRGRWTLLIGYFIPGVRHLTGYVAGVSKLSYANFALFAYTGAFCWAAVFISLGYLLGEQWNRVLESIHETKLLMIGLAVAAVLGYLIFSYLRRQQRHA
ncbi:MAG TPA: DedA family protein [Terriglobia bacterium]|jgi:membrane protein DedA with SNARE-associated domain